MNVDWYTKPLCSNGMYSYEYIAPDGMCGHTLWFATPKLARKALNEAIKYWRINKRKAEEKAGKEVA